MYTFELNIGSISTPVKDAGWIQVYPFVKGCTLKKSKVENEAFARTLLTGKIKFSGDEADAIITLADTVQDVSMLVKWKGVTIFTGLLNCRGEVDPQTRESWNEAEPEDSYTKIMAGKDKEINILGGAALLKSAKVDFQERLKLVFRPTTKWKTDDVAIYETTGQLATEIYARQELTVPDLLATLMIDQNGWYEVSTSGGSTVIARSWNKAGIDKDLFLLDMVKCQSVFSGQYAVNDYATFSAANCSNLSATYTGYIVAVDQQVGAPYDWEYFMIRDRFFQTGESFTYTRLRRLDDIITDMISVLDPSVTVDATTFDFGRTEYDNLLVGAMSDMKLIIDSLVKVETSDPASKELVTWSALWEALKSQPFGFYWYIDSGVLQVRHISELNTTSGSNPDLTSWLGVNWCENRQRYVCDNKKYSKIVRQSKAASPDFYGVDIIFESTDGEGELNINQDLIYTDIAHIFDAPGDYPDNGIVLLAGDEVTGQPHDYEIYTGTGVITGETIVNHPLANSTMDSISISTGDLPFPYTFNAAILNGQSETLQEIKRRRLNAIYAPFRTPDEVDFSELITTDNGDVDPEELEIPLEPIQGGAKITCIF